MGSSRDLFGRPLNLGRLVLLALNQHHQQQQEGKSGGAVRVVRVRPEALTALRKMQRLIQVCIMSIFSLGLIMW